MAAIADLAIDAYADGLVELDVVGTDEAFQVAAGTNLTLDVAGLALGRELTGEVSYRVWLDAALAQATQPGTDALHGHLVVRVPAGDHDLDVTAPGGARKRVRIMGR